MPRKITRLNQLIEDGEIIDGRWEIGKNHEIQYREKYGNKEIKLKGTILAVEPGTLVFAYTEKQTPRKVSTRIFKLTGQWQADSKNRLTFAIEKKQGKNDTLTFTGVWEVNESNEIIYTYERRELKTKTREIQSLVFKGYWDISERNRLAYYLGGDTDQALIFRGAFQTKSLLAKEGEIRYQIGFELRGKKQFQTIVLFGKWKVSKKLGLLFEMEYADGKKHAILFGAEYHVTDDTAIEVKLKSRDDKPLGVEVLLTKDIFNDGQAFLRFQKSLPETALEAGLRFTW